MDSLTSNVSSASSNIKTTNIRTEASNPNKKNRAKTSVRLSYKAKSRKAVKARLRNRVQRLANNVPESVTESNPGFTPVSTQGSVQESTLSLPTFSLPECTEPNPGICPNKPNHFCYICGQFTSTGKRRNITETINLAYTSYFGFEPANLDRWWTPKHCCVNCATYLTSWYRGSGTVKSMGFAVPVQWGEPTDHGTNCYFCMSKVKGGVRYNQRNRIVYPDIDSVRKVVPHSEDYPVPVRPEKAKVSKSIKPESLDTQVPEENPTEAQLFNQHRLDHLIRGLGPLPPQKETFLIQTLSSMGLLDLSKMQTRSKTRTSKNPPLDESINELDASNDDNKVEDDDDSKRDPNFGSKNPLLKRKDRYQCPACERTYAWKQSLDIHVGTIHGTIDGGLFECTDCEESFPRRSLLERHLVSHLRNSGADE